MTRQHIDAYAVALGIGRLFKRNSDLRVFPPEEAFHLHKCVEHMSDALRPHGHLDELAKVLVALFDDASLLQIYYDVRGHTGKTPLLTTLLETFSTLLSKRSMTKFRRDLSYPSRSPLAECIKRSGLK
jgi:hypothetical protein